MIIEKEDLKKIVEKIDLNIENFYNNGSNCQIDLDILIDQVKILYSYIIEIKHVKFNDVCLKNSDARPFISNPTNGKSSDNVGLLNVVENVPLPKEVELSKEVSTEDVLSKKSNDNIEIYKSVNDIAKNEKTLAEKMQLTPINDLRMAIGINDKFLLLNDLFNGSVDTYNSVISNLNSCQTAEDALNKLDMIAEKLQINREKSSFLVLCEFIHRRYL